MVWCGCVCLDICVLYVPIGALVETNQFDPTMLDELLDRCYNTGLEIAADCESAMFETREVNTRLSLFHRFNNITKMFTMQVAEKQAALLSVALAQSTYFWGLTHLRKVHVGIVPLAGGLGVASMIDQRSRETSRCVTFILGPPMPVW